MRYLVKLPASITSTLLQIVKIARSDHRFRCGCDRDRVYKNGHVFLIAKTRSGDHNNILEVCDNRENLDSRLKSEGFRVLLGPMELLREP